MFLFTFDCHWQMLRQVAKSIRILRFCLWAVRSVAWSDARPPGMRTVAGSIVGSGNILSLRLVMKSFQVGQLSVTGERMCT